ncbi:MAG TPA: putative sulfate exporter family transporter, partial [Holophagaceae bacterium]|nr:putative sulfate exporter family transporter [Holophagaceae bacterium]
MARALLYLLALLSLLPDIPVLHWHALKPWMALIAGILLTLSLGNPMAAQTRKWTPKLLAWSVVGLGAGMNLREVLKVGLQGFGYTAMGIVFALSLGLLLGHHLKVARNTSLLISVGTAICGGSAIAAVAPVIHAEDEDTSVALGTVFLLNAAALLIFPVIGHHFGMGQRPFGLWSALAIHDTSSVVGAATTYGREATVVATTTKLARALWIVPVTLAVGFWVARERHAHAEKVKAKRPWFILGFLLAAALVTYVPAMKPAGGVVAVLALRSLTLTLFLLGCGLSREAIRRVGARPMLQGVGLWFVVGGVTLFA